MTHPIDRLGKTKLAKLQEKGRKARSQDDVVAKRAEHAETADVDGYCKRPEEHYVLFNTRARVRE